MLNTSTNLFDLNFGVMQENHPTLFYSDWFGHSYLY